MVMVLGTSNMNDIDDSSELLPANNIIGIGEYQTNIGGDTMFDLFDHVFENLVGQEDYDQYGYKRPKIQKSTSVIPDSVVECSGVVMVMESVPVYQIPGGKFTIDQLVCIGQTLAKMVNKERLNRFIDDLNFEVVAKSETLLCLYLSYQLRLGNFAVIIDTIVNHQFQELNHKRLQNLWNEAHYRQYEKRRGKYPQEVQRFRIRKKHQFPQTIWNGQQYKYLFSLKDRAKLNEFFQSCPNPNRDQKIELSKITSLNFHQISTWFKNRRNRRGNPKQPKQSDNTNNVKVRPVKKTMKSKDNNKNGTSKKSKLTTTIDRVVGIEIATNQREQQPITQLA